MRTLARLSRNTHRSARIPRLPAVKAAPASTHCQNDAGTSAALGRTAEMIAIVVASPAINTAAPDAATTIQAIGRGAPAALAASVADPVTAVVTPGRRPGGRLASGESDGSRKSASAATR